MECEFLTMMSVTGILALILFFIALREASRPDSDKNSRRNAMRTVIFSFVAMVAYLVVFTIIALW